MIDPSLLDQTTQFLVEVDQLRAENERLKEELAEAKKDAEQMRSDFCAAINHAIRLGIEGDIFLLCWNEGDWESCAEYGFTPSNTLRGK